MKIEDIGIWLINLPTDVSRRSAMERQLTKLGLSWNLFPAINGKARRDDLLIRADVDAYQRNMGMTLLPGKLGVYASHLAVWEAFIASDLDVGLILEDDVVFHDDFIEALSTALAGRDHWDLVRFNAIRAKLPVTQGTLGKYRLNAYIGPFTGNACYLIKKAVGQKLVSGLWPQTRALDHELNRFFIHDYRQRGLEPFASHPDDQNVSTITGVGFANVKKFRWFSRLPHYRLKSANYLRRLLYLFSTGAFPGRKAPLSMREE